MKNPARRIFDLGCRVTARGQFLAGGLGRVPFGCAVLAAWFAFLGVLVMSI